MTSPPHLPFPFSGKAAILISKGTSTYEINAELARSDIEIFQSACYRGPEDLPRPLVLQFGNPAVQHFCLQNYDFPLEQILVEYESNKVVSINPLKPKQGEGHFIQGYAGLSCIILAGPGFANQHNIEIQNTLITIKITNYESGK